MMVLYSLILLVSTLICSFTVGRVMTFVLRELGMRTSFAQLATILSILAFMLVVNVPSGLVIGAVVLVWAGLFTPRHVAGFTITTLFPLLIAATLAVTGLQESPGHWPGGISDRGAVAIAWMVYVANVLIGYGARTTINRFNTTAAAAALPLALSVLFVPGVHTSLVLDASLIFAGLVGGLRTVRGDNMAAASVRQPMGLLLGYGIMEAIRYDAVAFAVLSLVIWVVGSTMAARRSHA